jgi:hypothetical protein
MQLQHNVNTMRYALQRRRPQQLQRGRGDAGTSGAHVAETSISQLQL